MGVKWKAFGFQRSWPDGEGSVWVEAAGTAKLPWEAFCSQCDVLERGETWEFKTVRAAQQVCDLHIKEHHPRKAKPR